MTLTARGIEAADAGRWFAHIIFSVLFVWDVAVNGNPFGFDNAGIYGVVTLGSESLLKFAGMRYGIGGNSNMDKESPENGDGPSAGDRVDDPDLACARGVARKPRGKGRQS